MNNDIKTDLDNARNLKNSGKYDEALKIFDKHYHHHSELFSAKDKEEYAWTLYKRYMQNSEDEDEIIKTANFITKLVNQKDLTSGHACVYTSSVFKVLNHLKDEDDYYIMPRWLSKINPDLLDEKPYRRYGRINKSKKEFFYDLSSKAYLKCGYLTECIETSKKALNTFETFYDAGDIWHKLRIAKSFKELNKFNESLKYYLEVIEVKNDWYMYRDIAEIYYLINKPFKAMEYICPVILSNQGDNIKAGIYLLCYNIFKGFNPEMALKHAQLFYLINLKKLYLVPKEISDLNIDETALDKESLEGEINDLWTQYKFKDQKIKTGFVFKYFDYKNYGFIKTESETVFFHKEEFKDTGIEIGQKVSFYTEESFDKSKNKRSLKAVNIHILNE